MSELDKINKEIKKLKQKMSDMHIKISELKRKAYKAGELFVREGSDRVPSEALKEASGLKSLTCKECKSKYPYTSILKYKNLFGNNQCPVCGDFLISGTEAKALKKLNTSLEKIRTELQDKIDSMRNLAKEELSDLLRDIRYTISKHTGTGEIREWEWDSYGRITMMFRNHDFAEHESYGYYEGDEAYDLMESGLKSKIDRSFNQSSMGKKYEWDINYHEKQWFSIDISPK